jgi:acetyltransferase-like isoleucine patch superfamily enzyme
MGQFMDGFNSIRSSLVNRWARFWLHYAGITISGRFASRMASLFVPPYKGCAILARLSPRGYIAPTARIHCAQLQLGARIFIGERVTLYDTDGSGSITIGERSSIHQDSIIETGLGGRLKIGENSHIQPRCQFSAYKGSIQIGNAVQVAPNCGFYPYDHGFLANELIRNQPLRTKGGIVIGDDAWLSFNVTVLDGVQIGKGAVIGAGAVVTTDIPEEAIAVGVPARVVGSRKQLGNVSNV